MFESKINTESFESNTPAVTKSNIKVLISHSKAVNQPERRNNINRGPLLIALRRQLLRLCCDNIFERIILVAHVVRILQRSVLKSHS